MATTCPAGTTQAAIAAYAEANGWNLSAYAGGDVNPFGLLSPAQSELDSVSLAPLFLGSDQVGPFFPCGPGQVGFTVCPPGAEPFDSGGFVVVSVVNAAPIPLLPDKVLLLDVDFTAGGGPLFEVMYGVDGWSITSNAGDTDARRSSAATA